MKKAIIIATLAIALIGLASAYTNTTGLLFELNFTNAVNDSLGLNNGTTTGTVTYPSNAYCPIANRYPCYNATGSSSQISVANTSIWRAGDTNVSKFMINFWIREKDVSANRNDRMLWANRTVTDVASITIISGSTTGRRYAQLIPGAGATSVFYGNLTPTADLAYMLTVRGNGTHLLTYINGTQMNTTAYLGGLMSSHQNVRWFGALNIATLASLNGTADEVTVWDMTGYSESDANTKISTMYDDYLDGYAPGENAAAPYYGHIYIDVVDGDDSNNGNRSHPVKTVRRADQLVSSGRNVIFLPGLGRVYRMPEIGFFNTSVMVSGTASNYTTVTCEDCPKDPKKMNYTNTPILTGSTLLRGNWTSAGSNRWKLTPTPNKPVANLLLGNITRFNFTVGYRESDASGISSLNVQGEWWQNRTYSGSGDYAVYMYSTADPDTYYDGIDLVWGESSNYGTTGVIFEVWGRSYWEVIGLYLFGADIGINSNGDNIHIINNTVSFIGGGYCISGCTGFTRWGNGIQSWEDADNWNISGNIVYEVYDAAISPQSTSGTGFTQTNIYIGHNIIFNSSYCFEHYFTPTSAGSRNITFEYNTCAYMGKGWYEQQRQFETAQTVEPRFLRFGAAYNVYDLVIQNNLFYNASQYAYGYQSLATIPGWNTSVNYTMRNNYIFKGTDPLFNETGWFNVPSVAKYYTLASWQAATVQDDGSVTETDFPFNDTDNTFIPNYYSAACNASTTGGYVGAVACETEAPATGKTTLHNNPDIWNDTANEINDVYGNCDYGDDDNWTTGNIVTGYTCTLMYWNYTSPGELESGNSSLMFRWASDQSGGGGYIPPVTTNLTLPTACEQSNVRIKAEGEVYSGYTWLNFTCYTGSEWVGMNSIYTYDPYLNGYPENFILYDVGMNFSRKKYITFNTATVNGSVTTSGESLRIDTLTENLGGVVTTKQYLYNSSNSLVSQLNSTASYLNSTTTLPIGTYYINASAENDTHVAYSDNLTMLVTMGLEITNPPSHNSTYNNYLNLTWEVTGTGPVNNFTIIREYDTSGAYLRTINASTNEDSLYISFNDSNVSTGYTVLRVIYNDTTNGFETYDEIGIYANLTTQYNITTVRSVNNASVESFTVTMTGDGLTTTASTTNGLVQINLTRGTVYNFTVSGSGLSVNSMSYGTNETVGNVTFVLDGITTLNITFLDEESGLLVNQSVRLDLIADNYGINYTASQGQLSISGLEADDYIMRYWFTGYETRFYYVTIDGTSSFEELTLYMINSTVSSNISIYVIDEVTNAVEGAVVKALKYDIVTNTYLLQEVAITDVSGKVIMSLTKNDEYYKFMIEYDDELLKTTNPAYITTDSVTIQVDFGDDFGEEYFNFDSISGAVTFNNNTNNFRLDYNDASGIGEEYCLYIYRNHESTIYNSSCSTTASGTILVGVSPDDDTVYKAKAYYVEEDVYKYLSGSSYEFPPTVVIASPQYGLFLQLILTLVFALTAIVAPWLASLAVPFSLIIGHALGLNAFTAATLTTMMTVGAILAVVLKVRR